MDDPEAPDTYVEYLLLRSKARASRMRPNMPEFEQAHSPFTYAVVRIVPRVERGERINAGVIVFCRQRDFLEALVDLDEVRLAALDPSVDAPTVREQLQGIVRVGGRRPVGRPDRGTAEVRPVRLARRAIEHDHPDL